MRTILIATRFFRRHKRQPLGVTPPGVPNTVLWGDRETEYIPASYLANLPEPKSPEKDKLWYMRPRLPLGVPWTPETAQWLEAEIKQWEIRYGMKGETK